MISIFLSLQGHEQPMGYGLQKPYANPEVLGAPRPMFTHLIQDHDS
ncbi:hypothetical protein BVRB_8g189770 [Beta vulgaris subsp. vulgaris]|nr:hypothetical protein BVRB_8g189770 [Beta vulgaris subsp. vulgaris]